MLLHLACACRFTISTTTIIQIVWKDNKVVVNLGYGVVKGNMTPSAVACESHNVLALTLLMNTKTTGHLSVHTVAASGNVDALRQVIDYYDDDSYYDDDDADQ
jgi:hypothetical protein